MAIFQHPSHIASPCAVALVFTLWCSWANAEPFYYTEGTCAGMSNTGFYETTWRVYPGKHSTSQRLPQAFEVPSPTSEWIEDEPPVREELPTMPERPTMPPLPDMPRRPATVPNARSTNAAPLSNGQAQPKDPGKEEPAPVETPPPARTPAPPRTPSHGMRSLPSLPPAPSTPQNTTQPAREETRTSLPKQGRTLPSFPSTSPTADSQPNVTPPSRPIRSTQPNAPSMPAVSTPDEVPFPSVPTPREGGRMLPWNRPAPDLTPAKPHPYGSRSDVAATDSGVRHGAAFPAGRQTRSIPATSGQPTPGHAYSPQETAPAAYYAPQQPAAEYSMPRMTAPGYGGKPGLGGYCPVALIDGDRWVSGDPRYSVVYRGTRFLTAGPEEQQRFLAEPERYSPVFDGHDPVLAVEDGRQVPGHPEFSVVFDGRIYLFSSAATLSHFRQHTDRFAP